VSKIDITKTSCTVGVLKLEKTIFLLDESLKYYLPMHEGLPVFGNFFKTIFSHYSSNRMAIEAGSEH